MQTSITKRHRCLSGYNNCRHSIDDTVPRDNLSVPWTCFRLPFCDNKQKEKNRVHEALVTHGLCCFHCGVRIQTNSDDDDGDCDTFHEIQPLFNYDSASPMSKHPNLVSCHNEETSTITTAAATSRASDSSRNHGDCNILATEIQYVSLDSLLRPKRTDGTTTTEMSSSEFSVESESKHYETIDSHCKCCRMSLSSNWKYCPTCGIYLDLGTY
jgi:hypothetical protein